MSNKTTFQIIDQKYDLSPFNNLKCIEKESADKSLKLASSGAQTQISSSTKPMLKWDSEGAEHWLIPSQYMLLVAKSAMMVVFSKVSMKILRYTDYKSIFVLDIKYLRSKQY